MDAIELRMSSFPLDYHLHSWQVAQVLPYLLDLCAEDSSNCGLMNEYFTYGLAQQETILSTTNTSLEQFIPAWSKSVSEELGLDYDSLVGIYDRDNDVHDTEMKTRTIWKYGAAKGVSGTPKAFINGVMLDSFPSSSEDWISTLQAVYESQWGVSTQSSQRDIL